MFEIGSSTPSGKRVGLDCRWDCALLLHCHFPLVRSLYIHKGMLVFLFFMLACLVACVSKSYGHADMMDWACDAS